MVALNCVPPAEWLREENRNGYTVSSHMKEVWAVEIDLLQELMRVCQKYGLRVFADGGTLIGAMRHKGFIPWDDDIDLCMPRADYDRLCEVAAQEFRQPYFWQTIHTDFHYTHRHAQLRRVDTAVWSSRKPRPTERFCQGIFIDIFIIDAMPYDPRALAKHYRRVGNAKLKLKVAIKVGKKLPEPVYRWCRNHTTWLSDTRRFAQLESVLRSVPYEKSGLHCIMSLRGSHKFHDAHWYDEVQMVPFEYVQIPVPAAYNDILTTHYGDWRTPTQSAAYHGSQQFDTERPYDKI